MSSRDKNSLTTFLRIVQQGDLQSPARAPRPWRLLILQLDVHIF